MTAAIDGICKKMATSITNTTIVLLYFRDVKVVDDLKIPNGYHVIMLYFDN